VVNITYQIEGLEAYIKHPIKQYVLLKHLPLDLRQGLIFARKYIFSLHEIITNMVYLGLAQFGPHSLKVNTTFQYFADFHVFETTIPGILGKGSSFYLFESENNFNGYHSFQSWISSHFT